MNDKISVDYSSIDILRQEQYDDLAYEYAEKVYEAEEYSDPVDFLSNCLAIEYFPNATFHELLQLYYSEQGENIEDKVRGYVPYRKGFLMHHGVGYSWESADLFGGSADGRAKGYFENWLWEKGFKLYDSSLDE